MVEDASSLPVLLITDGSKHVWVFAVVLAVPDSIKISLIKAALVSIDLFDGFGRSTSHFIGSNPDERSVLLVQASLGVFHITPSYLLHVPKPAD